MHRNMISKCLFYHSSRSLIIVLQLLAIIFTGSLLFNASWGD